MNSNDYIYFVESAEEVISSKKSPARFALFESKCNNLSDCDIHNFRLALDHTIENLDQYLLQFEQNFIGNNSSIFWAFDYNDIFTSLRAIFKAQKVKSVRLPKVDNSFTFRELGIKYFLRDENISLAEEGDVQFFNVDALFSDSGSLLVQNSSPKLIDILNNEKPNLFFATIDCLLHSSIWADKYTTLLNYRYHSENQNFILFKGSPNCKNFLFLIDNGRTNLMQHKSLRPALSCFHCGRCNDVCPVFQTIGDLPYNNVFTGPIANILLPQFEPLQCYEHVLSACTLCGRCEEVCPIHIPIRDMIISSRQELFSSHLMNKDDRVKLLSLRKLLSNRSKMNQNPHRKKRKLNKIISKTSRKNRSLPPFDKNSFYKSLICKE